MKKWTLVMLLFTVLFQTKLVKMDEMIGMFGDENNECRAKIHDVVEANKNTIILPPHRIFGKWVSGKCESRSPNFVLRSYTFFSNHTFQLLQFYYRDESCASVDYTVSMVGNYSLPKLHRRSSPSSAAHIRITLRKATIIAHDEKTATKLAKILNEKCPGLTKPHWKRHWEYVLFEANERVSNDRNPTSPDKFRSDGFSSGEYLQKKKYGDGCLAAINVSLDELSTVRIQSRYTFEGSSRYELLLANTYLTDQQLKTLPHKFQAPLILVNGTFKGCHICGKVDESTNMYVSILTAKSSLPLAVYGNGEWISERCEALLATGSFLMRLLRLHQKSKTWEQQTLYFTDYTCSNLMMKHETWGSFEVKPYSKRMLGADDIDFFIEKSFLTVFDEPTLQKIRTDLSCSVPQGWQLNERNEILSSTGCSSVGITYQQRNHDIARLETNDYGAPLLYLGDEENISHRPTAYKYPLLRCSSYVGDEELFQPDSADTIMLPLVPHTLVVVSVIHILLAILT